MNWLRHELHKCMNRAEAHEMFLRNIVVSATDWIGRTVGDAGPYNEIVCRGGFPCPPALEYDYLFTLFRLLTHTEKILAAWMRPLSSIS